MNALAVLPHLTPEQRGWIKERLIENQPHAKITKDFMKRHPDFGAGLPEAKVIQILRSRIKEMVSHGKERDEILSRRASTSDDQSVDHVPITHKRHRAELRQQAVDDLQDIRERLDSDKPISAEEYRRMRLKGGTAKELIQMLDSYERSEYRESRALSAGHGITIPETVTVEDDERHKSAKTKPRKAAKKALPPPEPREPEWWEKKGEGDLIL